MVHQHEADQHLCGFSSRTLKTRAHTDGEDEARVGKSRCHDPSRPAPDELSHGAAKICRNARPAEASTRRTACILKVICCQNAMKAAAAPNLAVPTAADDSQHPHRKGTHPILSQLLSGLFEGLLVSHHIHGVSCSLVHQVPAYKSGLI
jgi:hypothetical protein